MTPPYCSYNEQGSSAFFYYILKKALLVLQWCGLGLLEKVTNADPDVRVGSVSILRNS